MIERILTHTGWLEQKGGKGIGMDVSSERPILVGESKSRGDPTTILRPNYPGSWRSILENIPQFLEDLPSEDIPCRTKQSKTVHLLKSKLLVIVVPTRVLQSKDGLELGAGWSPKKKVRGVAKKLLKEISVKKEEENPTTDC